MAKSNMGVDDSEFLRAGKTISSYAEDLINRIDRYGKIVDSITGDAIKDKLICAKLENLKERVSVLRGPLMDISDAANKICNQYIDEIDSADSFLY